MNNVVSWALGAFLLSLVGGNFLLFFFITLSHRAPAQFHSQNAFPALSTIEDHIHYLAPQYINKNFKYETIQRQLYKYYNFSKTLDMKLADWSDLETLTSDGKLSGQIGHVLHAMKSAKIVLADNAQKGTQLKLQFTLEDNGKLYFKPKRYHINHIIRGKIYAGFDRHNSEVLGYYLAIVLNYKWVPPSVIRKVNIDKELVPSVTFGLNQTMSRKAQGELCIYGKCFYCRTNETVCEDERGEIEGAAILFLNNKFQILKSPWRQSYSNRKMDWEINENYCNLVKPTLTRSRLLDIIEVSIFDFLIQNGDRHRYEVYKSKILLLDNGKGLGNPYIDNIDILAPLYQCCMIRLSTWHHLELVSGGSLTQTVQVLGLLQGDVLATDLHYAAIERRLLTVYATVQRCIGRFGGAKVFK